MSLLECVAALSAILACVPVILIWKNWTLYQPAPVPGRIAFAPCCSVLIPARNEEANIEKAVRSVLQNTGGVDLEVLVADDHSTDSTAALVSALAAADARVRLISVPPLPPGWCGKAHACQLLGESATHPVLLFMDADVRLSPDALRRSAALMERTGADLLSGIPRQETGSLSEQLLIPLIHWVLLGFLPMGQMRASRKSSYAAGCGQFFMARAHAYLSSGGHRMLRASLHDGLHLPRSFRAAGFRTDLFDATDVASCRMYSSGGQTWRGLSRNAHEGLGAPALIGPVTFLLAGGQILPILLLFIAPIGGFAFLGALLATAAIFSVRFALALRFCQSWIGALLHPVGVAALLGLQWFAFARSALRRPARWRDRSYLPAPAL